MFDTVFFKCPNCSSEIEYQSHAGKELLENYNQDEVPLAIAGELLNSENPIVCLECKAEFNVVTEDKEYVSLFLK